MTPEEVDKSIKQMRGVFVFFGALGALSTLLYLFSAFSDGSYFILTVVWGAVSYSFLTAYKGLGTRNGSGYKFARISSFILLLGFPVLTIFGVMYLNKLGKPEMKQALNAG